MLEYFTKNNMTAVVLKKKVSVMVETDNPTLSVIGYKQLKKYVCYLIVNKCGARPHDGNKDSAGSRDTHGDWPETRSGNKLLYQLHRWRGIIAEVLWKQKHCLVFSVRLVYIV